MGWEGICPARTAHWDLLTIQRSKDKNKSSWSLIQPEWHFQWWMWMYLLLSQMTISNWHAVHSQSGRPPSLKILAGQLLFPALTVESVATTDGSKWKVNNSISIKQTASYNEPKVHTVCKWRRGFAFNQTRIRIFRSRFF